MKWTSDTVDPSVEGVTSIATPAGLPIEINPEIQQRIRTLNLRRALEAAHVPQATADQVVKEQEQVESQQYSFDGRVHFTIVGSDQSSAYVLGQDPQGRPQHVLITVPPNDPKFLAELVRAQNYQLRVHITFELASDSTSAKVLYIQTMA